MLHRVTHRGAPIVKGKRVTGFANSEEEEVSLTHVVPFLVEDELKRLGGFFEKAPNWQSFVIDDGRLITGQEPGLLDRRSAGSSEAAFRPNQQGGRSAITTSRKDKAPLKERGFCLTGCGDRIPPMPIQCGYRRVARRLPRN